LEIGKSGDTRHPLDALRTLQRLLDEAFRVPGTKVRFGWDPIIGLLPGAGELLAALMACTIIIRARQMRVPGVVLLRMLFNVGIDLVVGMVPILGDVADVFWKSNTRNLALLERHAAGLRRPTPGDWWFVAAIVGAIVAIAAVPFVLMYWVFSVLMSRGL
jgi:hypothetical protein